MSARLTEIQRQLGQTRRRLEELARRVAALRERVESGGPGKGLSGAAPAKDAAVPLFTDLGLGKGALDDVELTFEVLDTEDPGRDGR
jgi:hypothetical protein